MLSYRLRPILEEIIDPGGGDKPSGEILDPNDPEKKSKENKGKYKADGVKVKVYDAGSTKMWMPGGHV